MQGISLIDPFGQSKHIQDMERLTLECTRIMDGIYSPGVICFMLELAKSRGRLEQLREFVSTGLKADDIRRIIMIRTFYYSHELIQILSEGRTRFIWEFPFSQRGRFGNAWQRFMFRIRYWVHRIHR